MLQEERRTLILSELEITGIFDLKAFSLVHHVSEMTLYRDLQYLEAAGQLVRISGGAKQLPANSCTVCHKEVHQARYRVTMQMSTGVEKYTCCAHCALLYLKQHETEVLQVLGNDFMTDTTVNVRQATFVVGAELANACCAPNVYVFGNLSIAQKFSTAFGGQVLSFQQAVNEVSEVMSCCKHDSPS